MHSSVMDFLRQIPKNKIRGKDVLEIGSRDVNGSPRKIICDYKPRTCTGVDIIEGPGVDLIIDASELTHHFNGSNFELVISTEMLEHVEDWRKVVDNMKLMTAPGGLLVVTTRGPGFPNHEWPSDYWRFTPTLFKEIFSDMTLLKLEEDPMIPTVS